MSERPTPETDALECAFALLKCSPIGNLENSAEYGRAAYILSKHCQGKEDVSEAAMRIFAERINELEQERNEAREEWGKASMDAAQLLSEKTKVMAERDEAISDRDIARLEFEEISNDLKDSRNRIWRLEKQIEGLNNFANERYAEIQSVRKERDEAREFLKAASKGISKTGRLNQFLLSELIAVRKERDDIKEIASEFAMIASHCLGWHETQNPNQITSALSRWLEISSNELDT